MQTCVCACVLVRRCSHVCVCVAVCERVHVQSHSSHTAVYVYVHSVLDVDMHPCAGLRVLRLAGVSVGDDGCNPSMLAAVISWIIVLIATLFIAVGFMTAIPVVQVLLSNVADDRIQGEKPSLAHSHACMCNTNTQVCTHMCKCVCTHSCRCGAVRVCRA